MRVFVILKVSDYLLSLLSFFLLVQTSRRSSQVYMKLSRDFRVRLRRNPILRYSIILAAFVVFFAAAQAQQRTRFDGGRRGRGRDGGEDGGGIGEGIERVGDGGKEGGVRDDGNRGGGSSGRSETKWSDGVEKNWNVKTDYDGKDRRNIDVGRFTENGGGNGGGNGRRTENGKNGKSSTTNRFSCPAEGVFADPWDCRR